MWKVEGTGQEHPDIPFLFVCFKLKININVT